MGSALLPGQVFKSDLPRSVDSVLPKWEFAFLSPGSGPRFDGASFDAGSVLQLSGCRSVSGLVGGFVSDVYESAAEERVQGRCVFHSRGVVRLCV